MKKNIITNPNLSVETIGGKTQLFVKDGNYKKRPVTAPSGNGATGNMCHVTYDELVELRDNNKLIPGAKYRITDYETIVDENMGVKSAGHRFDIIVEALDDHTLSENASAIQQKYGITRKTIHCKYGDYIRTPEFDDLIDIGMFWCNVINYNTPTSDYLVTYNDDTKAGDEVANYFNGNLEYVEVTDITETTTDYFGSSNLAAWQLKYSLDNDKSLCIFSSIDSNGGITSINFVTMIPGAHGDVRIYNGLYIGKSESGKDFWALKVYDESYFVGIFYCSPIIEYPPTSEPYIVPIYSDEELTAQPPFLPNPGCYNFSGVVTKPTNGGKGTIYYMKDEFGNEAPYDFKNVLFDIGGGGESDILGVVGANGNYYEFVEVTTVDCSGKKDATHAYKFYNNESFYYANMLGISIGYDIYTTTAVGCSTITTIAEIVYDTSASSVLKYTFNMDEEGDFSMTGVCVNNIIKQYGDSLTILAFTHYIDIFADVTVLNKGKGLKICTIENDVAPYSYCIGEDIIPPYFIDMEMNNNDDNDNDNDNDIGKGGNESK